MLLCVVKYRSEIANRLELFKASRFSKFFFPQRLGEFCFLQVSFCALLVSFNRLFHLIGCGCYRRRQLSSGMQSFARR